jgi:uncharacterized BrkB/YihY/UPF0761 family membrane protein
MQKVKLTRSEWWKKYWKQVLTLVGAIFIVVSAVSGEGWSDYAEKGFWQNTWLVWQVVCIVAIVVFWSIHWFGKPKKRNQ